MKCFKPLMVVTFMIAFVGCGKSLGTPSPTPLTPPLNSIPTNFVKKGVIVFDNPGLKPGLPYFIYEAPGAPALTKEVILDDLSVCTTSSGSAICEAMMRELKTRGNEKHTVVDGLESENGIIVRKLSVSDIPEQIRLKQPGTVYISWSQAQELMAHCQTTSLMQTHDLDVLLVLKDGRRYTAVEPVIDEVIKVAQNLNSLCGPIPLATE